MKRHLLIGAAVVALVTVLRLFAFAVTSDDDSKPDGTSALTAEGLAARGVTSKAEWFASQPRTTVAQIAMACGMSYADARHYNDDLGTSFAPKTLSSFRSDCKG